MTTALRVGLVTIAMLLGGTVSAADPTYWGDVRPLLRKHCTVCHKESKRAEVEISAGLALDSLEAIKKGGPRPVLVPGKPGSSTLVTLLTETGKRRMPLDADPLPAEAIATIRAWVAAGAPEGTRPAEETTQGPTTATKPIRKLPITFPTKGKIPTGAVELVAPIGPLPPVAAVAFHPDGQRLAVGSYGRVVIWDLKQGKPSRVLTSVLGAVNDLRFSPDGTRLAVAGGQPSARGDLRLFDPADGKLIASLGGHLDTVSAVAFSPDGSKLVSASFDKTVRLWDVKSGKPIHTYTGHSDFVYAVAFAPSGEWYATASKDRTSRVVDVKTGQSRLTFSGMEQEVLSVGIRADGQQVFTSGFEPQIWIWDATTGQQVRKQGGHGVAVHELFVEPKGTRFLSAGGDRTVRLWNSQTGAAIRSIATESATFAVAIDPTGKRIASGGADGLTRVWDAESGRLLATLWAGAGSGPLGDWLAVVPEGYIVTAEELAPRLTYRAGGKLLTDTKAVAGMMSPKVVAQALAGEKITEFVGK